MKEVVSENVLSKRKKYFFPATANFYEKAPTIVKGSMQYLFDEEGKRYTDFFAGVSVMNCGHSNPAILKDTMKQLENLQHTTTLYLTYPNVDLAERLAKLLPGDLSRTFFCVTGSEANEGAMALARLHTGKDGFIALTGGLHGRTHLTLSVTGIPMWRLDEKLMKENVYFVERPYSQEKTYDEMMEVSINQLRSVLEQHGHRIAAMLVEPIQGNGGIIMYPQEYLQQVKALLEEFNVLLIVDEVQTGYGRTGKLYAIEHYGVIPDILVTAKALGNGIPISTFSTTEEIALSFNKPSASTFGGNPVAAVTALSVLNYLIEEKLVEKAKELGNYLQTELDALTSPFIQERRGCGLMQGLQIQATDETITSAQITDLILEKMKDRGFFLGKNGLNRDVIALQPPLIIQQEDIDAMLMNLKEVLQELEQS